jgi:hypothetical protein
MRVKCFASAALLLLCFAGAHAETDVPTAEALMRKSGLWQQLGGLAPQVRAGFFAAAAQSKPSLSPSETERVSKVLDDAYSPERLRAASLAVLSKELDERRVPDLNRWFAEPLGRRIAKLEEEAAVDQGTPQEQMSRGNELLRSMPEPRRTAIVDLVKASRSAETLTEMTIETAVAAAEGVASVTPDAPMLSSADLRHTLESQRPRLMVALSAISAAGFARMYASLSIDEIKRYVRFMKSDAGSHFNEAGAKAIGAAFKEGAMELGRRLPGTKDKSNT